MTIVESFSTFLDNIKVDSECSVSQRYKEITKRLNKSFRDTESETDNSLMVGSYGRYTGIKGISDLDMLYIMPGGSWDNYKSDPRALLNDTKKALLERYPNTDITFDQIVVQVKFSDDFMFEVQPVFKGDEEDGLPVYWFPDTRIGRYRKTKPKHEQRAMIEFREERGNHHRHLCKMVREWKDNVGVMMGGLLIDTLTYNFLQEKDDDYHTCGLAKYDYLVRDFFEYLKDRPAEQDTYHALGSGQEVKVKHPFRSKAKEAHKLACDAIEAETEFDRNERWRDLFGNSFPKAASAADAKMSSPAIRDEEEFIEDLYPVRLKYSVTIDCNAEKAGFRPKPLSDWLKGKSWLCHNLTLHFFIKNCNVDGNYVVKWKIRNVGPVAKQKNCLRGQIELSNEGYAGRKEHTNFYGPHYVECYIIKGGVVVAKDRIDVPIEH